MLRRSLPTALALCALGMSALPLSASGTSRASTAAQQTARDALAKFDKGEPGWRVRMTALVDLVKAGPDAVPVLVEALQNGTPTARAFAAQALVFIADSRARPALEKAVGDQEKQVRIYALNALSMFGRFKPAEQYRRLLEQDNWAVRRHMEFALERDDAPNAPALRKALSGYDLAKMDSARLGQLAPDFSLTDVLGRSYQLGEFRGKKPVVILFLTIA